MKEYKDYGYTSGKSSCAHAYLTQSIEQLLNKECNKVILDVGCGNGWLASHLIKLGYDVYGIDASESGIEQANKINHGHFFIQDIDAKKLPEELKNIPFKTIISTEVIEHLYDPKGYIAFCKNILQQNEGGNLIISTPYNGYLKNLVISIFNKWDIHLNPLWDGGHIKFWSRKTLLNVLSENGFKINSFSGVGRIPYIWKSMIIKAYVE